MSGMDAQTNIEAIAKFLSRKRSQNAPLRLFLGSRAGGLFDQDKLFTTLKARIADVNSLLPLLNSMADNLPKKLGERLSILDTLANTEKFRDCHTILKTHFHEDGIRDILLRSFVSMQLREEDLLLAKLIKAGFFGTIITTNLLEDACRYEGMNIPGDYQVFLCETGIHTPLPDARIGYSRIVKIFGDLNAYRYRSIGNELDLSVNLSLHQFLQDEMGQETLLIGYDPAWDHPIERCFVGSGAMLYYVNEEPLQQYTHLATILQQRGGGSLIGPEGSYHQFLKALYNHLEKEIQSATVASSPTAPSQPSTQVRQKVFISYSHQDNQEYLERLQVHLRGYRMISEKVIIWSDKQIAPGDKWQEEIGNALASTKVAILFVSADFLASDFIQKYELPELEKAAQAGEIKLLPVLLGPSAFAHTSLYQFQATNNFSQLLMHLSWEKREEIWAALAEQVFNILNTTN